MTFTEFLRAVGCDVEVTQEDDGSGYECLVVTIPPLSQMQSFDITLSKTP